MRYRVHVYRSSSSPRLNVELASILVSAPDRSTAVSKVMKRLRDSKIIPQNSATRAEHQGRGTLKSVVIFPYYYAKVTKARRGEKKSVVNRKLKARRC